MCLNIYLAHFYLLWLFQHFLLLNGKGLLSAISWVFLYFLVLKFLGVKVVLEVAGFMVFCEINVSLNLRTPTQFVLKRSRYLVALILKEEKGWQYFRFHFIEVLEGKCCYACCWFTCSLHNVRSYPTMFQHLDALMEESFILNEGKRALIGNVLGFFWFSYSEVFGGKRWFGCWFTSMLQHKCFIESHFCFNNDFDVYILKEGKGL